MLNNDEVIGKRYRIIRHLNRGMMANAYEAQHLTARKRVFLKEYISPRPSVSWYSAFVRHQKELTKALRDSNAAQFCLLPEETFEERTRVTAAGEERRTPPTLYQAFEFIKGGLDLEKRLSSSLSWDDRRMFASVFVFGLRELHGAGVIHADLKPANLQIVERPSAGGKMIRTPRLIDMDFSLLSAKRAPWHGHSGYVGTAGYLSPEHLAGADAAPMAASDMFTAGIILHELLGKVHPLRGLGDVEYLSKVQRGKVPEIELRGTFGRPDQDRRVIDLVSRCLSFEASRRPSAVELHQAIVGMAVPPPGSTVPKPPSHPPAAPAAGARLSLSNGTAKLDFGVTAPIGRDLLARLGPDAQFASTVQFRLVKDGAAWFVEHVAQGGNETLLNGRKVEGRVRLSAGDRIAIGNSARAIEKLPMRVEVCE